MPVKNLNKPNETEFLKNLTLIDAISYNHSRKRSKRRNEPKKPRKCLKVTRILPNPKIAAVLA